MSISEVPSTLDVAALRGHVREMYTTFARDPGGEFHFETGRALAERLGYPAAWLDFVPEPALESFAGVGHMLDLAALWPGERVLDLGSGSGTDAFIATRLVSPGGTVTGVDMTPAQVDKARTLRDRNRIRNVSFCKGSVERPPAEPASYDAVISNGVINLVPDKPRVFEAVGCALRTGGRLAVADIVASRPIKERTRGNATLWAACIAGAATLDEYTAAVEAAGLRIETVRENDAYRFTSPGALGAVATYGVRSVSILAVKP
jgi:arsenite methyltransferase